MLEAIATARTARSAIADSTSTTCASKRVARARAASVLTSITYFKRTSGWRARLPAWISPMRPAPKSAISMGVLSDIELLHFALFFQIQFESIGQPDEQCLAQTHGA